MKSIILVIVCLFMLSACGKNSNIKSLTCNANVSDSSSVVNIKFDEKNHKVIECNMKQTIDMSLYSDEKLASFDTSSFCERLETSDVTECNAKMEGKKLIVNTVFDIEAMNAQLTKDVTFDMIKEKYESELNATCKVN